jgi:hypothetical protein
MFEVATVRLDVEVFPAGSRWMTELRCVKKSVAV